VVSERDNAAERVAGGQPASTAHNHVSVDGKLNGYGLEVDV
jgi:hypothetical protein